MTIKNGYYKAVIHFNDFIKKWDVKFYCFNSIDYEVRGSYGTGTKCYESKEKAVAAAKRYVNKNRK